MSLIKPNQKKVLLAALIVASLALAYSNTFTAPFIFDDTINIVENESIRQLWPPWAPFEIPSDTGLAGRPVSWGLGSLSSWPLPPLFPFPTLPSNIASISRRQPS